MSERDESSAVWARLSLDREYCIGVGQCEMLAPDVFRLDDDDATSVLVGSPWLPQARAELLADKCPSGAITVAESGARVPARPTPSGDRPTAPPGRRDAARGCPSARTPNSGGPPDSTR